MMSAMQPCGSFSTLRRERQPMVRLVSAHGFSIDAHLFNRTRSRLRGCLGRDLPRRDAGALLLPCNGVHGFFMSRAFDAVFLDADGVVIDIRRLSPWQLARASAAFATLELSAGLAGEMGLQTGQRLQWSTGCVVDASGATGAAAATN